MGTILVGFTLQDAYARQGAKSFECVETTVAAAQAAASDLYTDFGGVSDLGLVKETYSTESLVFGAAQAGANLDTGGTLRLRVNDGSVYSMKIPGIKPSLVNSDGSIKADSEAILAYVANFEASGKFRVKNGTQYVIGILGGELDR